jgi:hypothetical protein
MPVGEDVEVTVAPDQWSPTAPLPWRSINGEIFPERCDVDRRSVAEVPFRGTHIAL